MRNTIKLNKVQLAKCQCGGVGGANGGLPLFEGKQKLGDGTVMLKSE